MFGTPGNIKARFLEHVSDTKKDRKCGTGVSLIYSAKVLTRHID